MFNEQLAIDIAAEIAKVEKRCFNAATAKVSMITPEEVILTFAPHSCSCHSAVSRFTYPTRRLEEAYYGKAEEASQADEAG